MNSSKRGVLLKVVLSVKPKSKDMVIPSQALTDRKRNMLIINNKEFYESPYEGYLVSKDGIVVSVRVRGWDKLNYSKPTFLSYKIDKDGYYEVLLSINKKRYYKKVHQLIAETFIGKQEGLVVDHINSNRRDNRLENLRYISNSENVSRGRTGVKPSIAREVKLILNDVEVNFGSVLDCCKYLNISKNSFYRLIKNECGKRFKYNIISVKEGVSTIEITLESGRE